ncbi:MAG: hypothetical protein KDD19_11105 [Phaeodactylibacter sp.]|nr:hypothetical protein [Phaeodactylibacter sp.]MCB9053862.1 hypothetical protein [Lewinellaceae bacterium]
MENTIARKPVPREPPHRNRNRKRPPFPWLLLLLLLISLTIGIRNEVQMSRKYIEGTEGHVYLDEDGTPEVIPEVYEKLERQKKNREDCVQYVAVAFDDGYRACYTCPSGQKTIFLKAMEIWKYGETCDYESRKNDPEYKANRVRLIPQNYGTKDYCFKIQLDSIYLYKKHPENLMRLKTTGI